MFYLLHQWTTFRFTGKGIAFSHPIFRHRNGSIFWSDIDRYEVRWARFLHGRKSHPIVAVYAQGRSFRVNGAVNSGLERLIAELERHAPLKKDGPGPQ